MLFIRRALHNLVIPNKDGRNDLYIEELVSVYNANIHIKGPFRLTPLEYLMGRPFYVEAAMKLVRLGANPDSCDNQGYSLLHRIVMGNEHGRNDSVIKELGNLLNTPRTTPLQRLKDRYNDEHHQSRSNFLNLLILLVNDGVNSHSESHFRKLPMELVYYIISFLDFSSMGKEQQEGIALAEAVFNQPTEIKLMAGTAGGINVFQQNVSETEKPIFVFFKSAQTLCLDFERAKEKLKSIQSHKNPIWDKLTKKELTNTSASELEKFKDTYAIACWNAHSSFYKNPMKLFSSIKNIEPYASKQIQSQLKLK